MKGPDCVFKSRTDHMSIDHCHFWAVMPILLNVS
ncbi:hypothetical protein SAMN05216269_1147 [Flavobacterium xinjiangense]|uniref:Uncharacterized protein n=1 Tax=Flavobacterium xinjiangense TaxID=178356 RepID=A0A1M7P595_9FLAO|nr:hypothetical protein SAMN05216269_1147 [Flavobacterium xinjiangense]